MTTFAYKFGLARAVASAFSSKRFLAGNAPPPSSPEDSPVGNCSSFAPPPELHSPYVKPVSAASSIVSVMPAHLPSVHPAATVAATRPVTTVPAISAGVSRHAPPTMVSHISLPV